MILCCLFLLSAGNRNHPEEKEIRALWVVRHNLNTAEKVKQLIADAVDCGINMLFVQVRGRGDAYYESKVVVPAENLEKGFDPLEAIVKAAKPHQIEVHAWLNVYYIWSAPKAPVQSGHIYHTHPEFSAVSHTSEKMIATPMDDLKGDGVEGVYFSPADEGYRSHFLEVVEEVINQYDVDGVHLDYIRQPGPEYDYSVSTRTRFMLETHVDPYALVNEVDSLKTRFGPNGFRYLSTYWDEFRRNLVTEFVREINRTVKKKKSSLKLSAAVFADRDAARNRVFQDWTDWVMNDFVDFVVPMNYVTNHGTFEKRVYEMKKHVPLNRVLMGVAIYNQEFSWAAKKVGLVRSMDLMGYCLFSYDIMYENRTYRNQIKKLNAN